MCQICILLDNTWPSPKELAHAINEIGPTDSHLFIIEQKIAKKLQEINPNQWKIHSKYVDDLYIEILKEFK